MNINESSPLIFKNKFINKINSDYEHQIYYLSDINEDEIIFLYNNSKNNFKFNLEQVKIYTDEDFKLRKEDKFFACSPLFDLTDYDIGGYLLKFERIEKNLYEITYGYDFSVNSESNDYMRKIKANSIFLSKGISYLFDKFPEIEIFGTIADFRCSKRFNIKDPINDFNRRLKFFKKNKFKRLDICNFKIIQNETLYFDKIYSFVLNKNKNNFLYLNKNIFLK